jgi:tRNA-dihydrouridine synthase A
VVHRLKADFPSLHFILNGGLRDHDTALQAGQGLDGVMIGREAYENPWMLSATDAKWFGAAPVARTRRSVALAMADYAERFRDLPARTILRHLLGLYRGQSGARLWRRLLSGSLAAQVGAAPELLRQALDQVDPV